jgi:membrane associated rhomboid family serine protease
MAIDRGTRRETFVYCFEMCAAIGTLGGLAWGIYQGLGDTPFELVMSAIRFGIGGFIGGSVVGVVMGVLAVIVGTIFR